MGDFDITLKRLSDEFTVDYARFALDDEEIDLVDKIDVSKIDKELPLLTREADCLAKVAERDGKEFILHIDFQAEYRHNIPDRMLGYTYRVYEKYKLPVYSVLIVLKKTGVEIRTKTQIKVRDLKSLRHEYKVIKLWEVEAEKILEKKITGLYPLLPLMKTDKTGEEIISEAARLIEKEVEDIEQKADAYVALKTFSAISLSKSLVDKILKRRDIMLQSPVYQEILQEGEMIGIGKGKVLGIEEGMERSILEVLEERFGFVSSKLEQEMKGLQGMKVCDFLLRKAVKVSSIEEFKDFLEKVKQEV
ncbi:hypothetical protein KJ693_03945 [bacterium]|nr:hypothetical protein [bacterium]MBU1614446.1 hypothetical protein [bacterium]